MSTVLVLCDMDIDQRSKRLEETKWLLFSLQIKFF